MQFYKPHLLDAELNKEKSTLRKFIYFFCGYKLLKFLRIRGSEMGKRCQFLLKRK